MQGQAGEQPLSSAAAQAAGPHLLDDLGGHAGKLSQVHGLPSSLRSTELSYMWEGNIREKRRARQRGLTATLGWEDGTVWGTMRPA